MNGLRTIARVFFGCRHEATYRERRPLMGSDVMHLVCHECDHAVPVIDRTADEHQRVTQTGAVVLPHARRSAAHAIRMAPSRRRSA